MSGLWSVRNGFLGCSRVAALVTADSEEEAREKGSAAIAAEHQRNRQLEDAEEYRTVESAIRVTLPYVGDELP